MKKEAVKKIMMKQVSFISCDGVRLDAEWNYFHDQVEATKAFHENILELPGVKYSITTRTEIDIPVKQERLGPKDRSYSERELKELKKRLARTSNIPAKHT